MEPFEIVRSRIESVKSNEIRIFLKAAYLLAAQGYELTGKLDSRTGKLQRKPDTVYGPRGSDVTKMRIDLKDNGTAEIALFRIRSSRRNVISHRTIALPILNGDLWAEELYSFFLSRNNQYVFPFNRQKVWHYITYKERVFDELTFQTRAYKYDNMSGEQVMSLAHPRLVKIHHLPILRSYELTDKYGFDSKDIQMYYGSASLRKSLPALTKGIFENPNWHKYIIKLLKKN
jgi:hypothetical protein